MHREALFICAFPSNPLFWYCANKDRCLTPPQVSNWFANARRRLKNTVKQPDLTWASRIKLYNSCVEGNAELFSICSDDSCPDTDDDMMGKG